MKENPKVLFINPSRNLRKQNTNEPLWAENLAAVLEPEGVQVQILDATVESVTRDKITGFDFVAITAMTPQYPAALALLKMIQEENARSKHKIHTIIGGPHVTLVKDTARDGWDTTCRGEGEEVISHIINEEFKGEIVASPISNLDKLPYPARHLVNLNDYQREGESITSVSICGMRGCPYSCVYCASPLLGGPVRFRSSDNVLGEIDDVIDKYGVRTVTFYDQTFTLNRQRAIELCRGLEEREVIWRCETRVDRVDHQLLSIMHQSGCQEVSFGIESADPRVIRFMNKGGEYNTQKAKDAIMMAKDAGIAVRTFFMFGFPDDSWDSVDNNMRFIEEASPDKVRLSLLTPFPGTQLYINASEYGIELPPNMAQYQYYGPEGVGDASYTPVIRRTRHLDEAQFLEATMAFQQGIVEWAARSDASKMSITL